MTTPLVQSISDEQLADLEDWCARETFKDCNTSSTTMGELRGLIARLREAEADAKRYRWIAHRPRWASTHVDFDNTGTYREHRVVWFTGDDWPHATGQTLDEAIDAAMESTP